MKNNKMIKITVVSILILVAIGIGYKVYEKTLTPNDHENIESEVNPEEIEKNKSTVNVTDIEESEPVKEDNEEVKTEVEKPAVPPAPELPEQEVDEEHPVAEEDKLPDGEHEVLEGDTEFNPEPPVREEAPKVESKPVENPVVVNPDTPAEPKDTNTNKNSDEDGSNLVPDNENPFAKPPKAAPNNQSPGETQGEEYYQDDRKAGEGDKF
ncbi:hypothetical protein [Maledivibacter halophilus]|uniref:Uncharacterized protein n=1 Tax=Maledivibacter halophilus TaxID=36842 RepID=A0A1T5LPX3_9FIRM|nr:hypothetical protein [Maledivibacter halophilus]SKC77609.1 hypothetical protein SAMN02194393_03159 [Maledivibacter halophilus]